MTTELLDFVRRHMDAAPVMFWALVLAVLAIFSAERALWLLYLMVQVRRRWFPEGRFVLISWQQGGEWDRYMEDAVMPSISDYAVVAGLPGGPGVLPESDAVLADRLVRAIAGPDNTGPVAVVFLPYFTYDTIYFGDGPASPDGQDYLTKKKTARLVTLVEEHKDQMRVYI